MAAIAKLIRNAPRDSLEAFLNAQQCPLGDRLRSFGPEDDYAGPLLKAVEELSDEDHARLTDNADRVTRMATEAGQTALLSVVQDRLLIEELESAEARSLWTFLNEPASFQRAEQVCYTDGHRYGARMWNGYEGPKGVVPDATEATIDTFKQAARKVFGSLKAHCDIYRRTRPNCDQPESELHQLTLFHDDLPDTYLEFDLEHETPVRRRRRPAIEVSITYEPATGLIEVVASAGQLRDQLARIFADTILRREIAAKRIVVRKFDLFRLLQPFDFPFDPADAIESIELVLLRLHQMNNPKRRLTLECPRRADGTIWDQAREELAGGADLANAGYVATKATISIKFLAGPGSPRSETLTFNITLPSGSDLKSQTERQRLIGERYVRAWGLVAEV